jgi:hypothetical protein
MTRIETKAWAQYVWCSGAVANKTDPKRNDVIDISMM